MTSDAFSEYVRQTSRKLYGFAYRILRNQEESEDAVQEIFVRLWNMKRKLEEYNSIDALATTMIRNYCIDQVRKKKNQAEIETSGIETMTDSPHELLESEESHNIIKHIINSLPLIYKEVINMKDVQGFSYEEISEITGQNINTLRVNLSRARSMLREEYKKYFNEKRRIGLSAGKVL